MGRIHTILTDAEYFVVAAILCVAASLTVTGILLSIDIMDEINEFEEKARGDLEEFNIIADDVIQSIDHKIFIFQNGPNINPDVTTNDQSYRETFEAILRLYKYDRHSKYCYRKPCK